MPHHKDGDGASGKSDEAASLDWAREYKSPVERFAQLPEPTRAFLEDLREDDLKDLAEAIRFYHSVRVIGRFWKWLIITTVAIFVGAATLGEAIQKLWHWILPKGSP